MSDIKADWTSLRASVLSTRSTDIDCSRSTTASMSEASYAGMSLDSYAPGSKVALSDAELRACALVAANKLDFRTLTDTSLSKWVWKQSRREFMLFESTGASTSANTDALPQHQHAPHHREVLLAGDINCSIDEIAAVLRTRSEAGLNATMKALYASEFIYGALVHAAPLTATAGMSECESDVDSAAAPIQTNANYVAVKTSTFVRPSLLTHHHEWCFLESFDRSSNGDSLVVTQSSIDAAVLRAGKTAEYARVDQLRGLSTAFLVERIPRTRSVRLVFHGHFDPALSSSSSSASSRRLSTHQLNPFNKLVSSGATAAAATRLHKLAKGVSRLPEIVRRRRVGIQTLASQSALKATNNARCTCCATSLRLRSRKKQAQCELCAHRVCDKCVTREHIETQYGHVGSVLLCTRCREGVDACEYDGVVGASQRDQQRYPVSVELDVDAMAATLRAKAFINVLATALDDNDDRDSNSNNNNNNNSNTSRRDTSDAAATVIRYMVDDWADSSGAWLSDHFRSSDQQPQQQEETDSSSKNHSLSHTDATTTSDSTSKDDAASTQPLQHPTKADLLRAVERTLERAAASLLPLSECKLASTDGRNYAIAIPANPASTAPDAPLPENEAERLDAIRALRLTVSEDVPELDMICALAAQELGCALGMVAVVEQNEGFVLACNDSNNIYRRTPPARNQSFCQHTIMGDAPLLVRYPEADVRFHALDAVATHGIRFYCGFPLTARDGTVIGSVCCIDTQQRALSQSQYVTMQMLARTASKVLWSRGDDGEPMHRS